MKDLFVPLIVLVTMGSMLLPIPAPVLDFLIVTNICLALLLLISSLYISDTLKISALPTLLLVSTLYRLSLNVASTRSILGSGEGGKVIEAFGAVVIGGNLVVGLVIFLVITLIQFVVIAKGSERVAEVAARFTLDALPGKQMSIDADVRAGLIDFETARKRRNEMQTESRFYGALDGAMKFIKGDAIAGVIIAAINIVAGIALGLVSEGLSLSAAVSKYTLLTVGDGLVSQIPALLSALAAGIVVTKVSRGDGLNVAQELLAQMGQVKAAKFIIAGFCCALALVPGMPLVPFATLTILLLLSAILSRKAEPDSQEQATMFEPKRSPLVEVFIPTALAGKLGSENELKKEINRTREEIYASTGILLLAPNFSIDKNIENDFRIEIRGITAFREKIVSDNNLVLKQLMNALCHIIEKRKAEIIDDIQSRRLLDFLDKDHPELVASVVPGAITVTQLTEILRALARENLSIKPIELILQGIAESNVKADGTRAILEDVRVCMGRMIVNQHLGNDMKLSCLIVDTALDALIAKAERNGDPIPLEAVTLASDQICTFDYSSLVLVCSKASRALLRDCLKIRRVDIPVLAHEEISEDVELEVKSIVGSMDDEQTEKAIASLAA